MNRGSHDRPTDRPLLSVVIPVYNESETIREIVRRVLATPYTKEILVIDDQDI